MNLAKDDHSPASSAFHIKLEPPFHKGLNTSRLHPPNYPELRFSSCNRIRSAEILLLLERNPSYYI
jgi:hypothetical protein